MNTTGRKTVKGEKTSAPKKASAQKGAGAAAKAPTHEEIAKRSYELFLERGGAHGHDQEDWARAEAELQARA